ncbi:MAG: SNF2-related protein [Janthinobacterium lividum]
MAGQTLTEAVVDIPAMAARTDSGTFQRGRTYYMEGRVRLLRLEAMAADAEVRGAEVYQISFQMDEGRMASVCDCPISDGDPDKMCKHQIAAAFVLKDYLHKHPPQTWQTVLTQAVKVSTRSSISTPRLALFFSLQQRHSEWAIFPYSLALSLFPDGMPDDPEVLGKVIKQLKLSKQAKTLRSQIDPRRFSSAFGGREGLLNLIALAGEGSYSYYYEKAFEPKALLPLLAGGFVFRGRENDPLQIPLSVSAEPGRAEVALVRTDAGMVLHPTVTLGDNMFSLVPEKTAIVSEDPLWLLSKAMLYPIEEGAGLVMTLLDNPDLTVPADEAETFFETFLLPIAEQVSVTGEGIVWEEEAVAAPIPRLYLSEAEGTLHIHLRFGYGESEVAYGRSASNTMLLRKPDSLTLVRLKRQPDTEQRWGEMVTERGLKRGGEPGQFALRARTDVVDFLLTQVPRLTAAGYEIYGEAELASAKVNRSTPTISFRVSSEIDWFDVQAVVQFGDTQITLKEVRKAVRKRERFVKLADGSIGEIPPEWLEKYRYLFSMSQDTDDGLRLAGAQITLLDQLLLEGNRVEADEEFQRRREHLRGFEQIEPTEMPKNLQGELRPYQKSGVDWLHFLHDYGFGGCLADDMGTGKTFTTLAFLQSLSENHPAKAATLLVLPRSLIFNWEREAAKFTPGLRLLNHAHATRAKDVAQFDDYDLVLTTYGILLRDIEILRQHRFHYVILDEAQAIKNPVSQSAKAVRLLSSDHKLSLTGTPVENSTLELWSQFSFLNPGLLGNLEHFRTEFSGAIEKNHDEIAAAFLRKLVHPFILRRTKDQVATDLPPRTEEILYVELEPGQKKLYDKTRDFYRDQILGVVEKEGLNDVRMKILEGLLRLRQIANHPKLVEPASRAASGKFERLLEILETLRAEGHKALVFSQFVQMLTLVREALDARQIPYAYLDGQTKDREGRVDSFQNDPSLPFFLISLKAGGVGLNLTAADYVIHIDPWWNPAVEMQATDRTHRIGQDKPVFVYKFITRDTVEEKILLLQDRKRALVSQLISTETSFFKSLTKQDIELLFE